MTDCGPKNCKQFCYQFVTENLLVILTLLAVIVGIIVGISVRQINPSQDVIIWIGKFILYSFFLVGCMNDLTVIT